MARLAGRVALITGAAGGIGGAIARRLAAEGAAVAVTDVRTAEVRELARELEATGTRALPLTHDVTDEASWEAVIRTTVRDLGGLDVLVNNAGVGDRAAVGELTLSAYNRVVSITQTSVFLGLTHAAAPLRASGRGAVINISSICGVTGTSGRSFAYHAAKGAVGQMTKNSAVHWATDGIRVNSVHPAYIETPGVLDKGPELVRELVAGVPMGRLGRPDEVAAAVAFLAGDDAAFITGAELHVDGGFLAR